MERIIDMHAPRSVMAACLLLGAATGAAAQDRSGEEVFGDTAKGAAKGAVIGGIAGDAGAGAAAGAVGSVIMGGLRRR